jgi:molybdopterin-guanine dinucleotide biosynthesis protein A
LKTGGIILAGGKSSRLGREKARVEIGGISLLQRAVSNLEFLQSEIIVVTAPESELPPVSAGVDLKVVQDVVSGSGPLAGIFTGLLNSSCRYNLVVACDMPLLNRPFLEYLLSVTDKQDAVVPKIGRYLEPLHAVYAKECLSEIEKLLAQDVLKIDSLFSRIHTRFVEPDEIGRFDPEHLSFFNINTPSDLQKAEELIKNRKNHG